MPDSTLKPRPATIPFGKDEGTTSYPAKVIETPFVKWGHTNKIENAYKNKKGDIIFSTGSDWYVQAKDGKEAYRIITKGEATTSTGAEGIIGGEITFSTNAKGENENVLKIDKATRQASYDGQPLITLSAKEKTELLESSKKTTFLGLPDVRTIEQALQLPNKEYLVVSASQTDYSYDTLRVFKGKDPKNLKEIPVTDVDRYRDGGTTYYRTKEGTLFSPTPFERDKATTWTPADSDKPIELKRLNRKEAQEVIDKLGNDTRIIGIKTWDEHVKESGKPKGADSKLDPNMKKALDEFQKGSGAPGDSSAKLPQKQRGKLPPSP